MKLRTSILFFAFIAFVLTASSTAFAQDEVTAPDGLQEYSIDANHSSVVFRIKHMDMGYVFGMFRGYDGGLVLDDDNLDESSFHFTLEAQSIFTNNDTRDSHLTSPDFFAAEEHPEIAFQSTKFERVNDRTYQVTGDLTMRGHTEEIEIMVDQTGQGIDSSDQFRRGFLATFAVNRMDFGVNEMPDGLSHHVRVTFSTQAFIAEE